MNDKIIPWRQIKFKDFVILQRGFDLPKSERKLGKYPIVASTAIDGFHDEYKVEPPCVATGRSGALGKVQYITDPCWPLNTALWVKDFKNNDPRFVYYFLGTLKLQQYNAGAGVPTLNRNHLDEIDIRIPEKHIQEQISTYLSNFDDLIENNIKRIKILENLVDSIYYEWFIQYRFPGHEKVEMVDSGTDLGEMPKGWEVKAASEAIDINPRTQITGEGYFLSMDGLSTSSMLISNIKRRVVSSGSKFKNGDTLFARITPCLENGKTGYVQFLPTDKTVGCGSTEFIVLRSKSLSPEYVYLLARQEDFRKNAQQSMTGASGRQRVKPECFDKYLLASPDEQTLSNFTNLVRPMFHLCHVLGERNEKLKTCRDLLLPKLISGQLSVAELA